MVEFAFAFSKGLAPVKADVVPTAIAFQGFLEWLEVNPLGDFLELSRKIRYRFEPMVLQDLLAHLQPFVVIDLVDQALVTRKEIHRILV